MSEKEFSAALNEALKHVSPYRRTILSMMLAATATAPLTNSALAVGQQTTATQTQKRATTNTIKSNATTLKSPALPGQSGNADKPDNSYKNAQKESGATVLGNQTSPDKPDNSYKNAQKGTGSPLGNQTSPDKPDNSYKNAQKESGAAVLGNQTSPDKPDNSYKNAQKGTGAASGLGVSSSTKPAASGSSYGSFKSSYSDLSPKSSSLSGDNKTSLEHKTLGTSTLKESADPSLKSSYKESPAALDSEHKVSDTSLKYEPSSSAINGENTELKSSALKSSALKSSATAYKAKATTIK